MSSCNLHVVNITEQQMYNTRQIIICNWQPDSKNKPASEHTCDVPEDTIQQEVFVKHITNMKSQ